MEPEPENWTPVMPKSATEQEPNLIQSTPHPLNMFREDSY
jgi:hypothetical protein